MKQSLLVIILSIAVMGCSTYEKKVIEPRSDVENPIAESENTQAEPENTQAESENVKAFSLTPPYCSKGERIDGWQCVGGLDEYDTGLWRCMQKSGCLCRC